MFQSRSRFPNQNHQAALQIAVRVFSHVSLAHLPVHVVAIGPVRGGQIFFDGNDGNGRHLLHCSPGYNRL